MAQGVPTQWALMLASAELERADLGALRVAGTGAARVPAVHGRPRCAAASGVPVVVRYTSTEASLGTGTTLTSSDEEVATTVGRPVAGVELAIVDDEGRPVPAGIGRPRPAALGRRHARLLGTAARAGDAASTSWSTPTATATVLAPTAG